MLVWWMQIAWRWIGARPSATTMLTNATWVIRTKRKCHFDEILVTACNGQRWFRQHYNDVIMSAMASQITSVACVSSTVWSGADQRKHQSSASLGFVRGIHRRPVNSPHKGPVTRKMFPFHDVIMKWRKFPSASCLSHHSRDLYIGSPLVPLVLADLSPHSCCKRSLWSWIPLGTGLVDGGIRYGNHCSSWQNGCGRDGVFDKVLAPTFNQQIV